MFNPNTYTQDLILDNGIFHSKKESKISYPNSGNDDYFQIEESSFWFKHRNRCIIETVKKYTPDKHFFDIGGGNGFVSKGLEQNGIETILVEPGIHGCLNAKKRNLKNIVCSTLENANFKPNSIPTIGLFDVVEHIENDTLFLKSIYSFLNPGGFVFITVPAYNILWSNEDIDAGHYRRYNLSSIESKLKEHGFSIEYSTYIFSFLPLPILFSRTIPSKLGLNKNSDELEKHQKEHSTNSSSFLKVIQNILDIEIQKIKKGSKIPFGSSCFVIAKKKNSI